MAKAPTHRDGARTQPAFQIIRQVLIHAMAKKDVATLDIAKKLDHSRSFVIKQVKLALKPRTASERRLLKVAAEFESTFKSMGLSGLLRAEDVDTVLAGGERPKLGPLTERRAAAKKAPKPAKPAKAKTPRPAKPAKAKADPTPAKQAAKPVSSPKGARINRDAVAAGRKAAAEAKAAKAPKAAKPAKASKPSAKRLKAPLPAPRLAEEPQSEPASTPAPIEAPATGDDLLDALGLGAPSPDAPV